MKDWTDDAMMINMVLIIIAGILVLGFLVVAYFTVSMILTLFLAGAGVYLLIRPQYLSGLSPMWRVIIPIMLILLGVLVWTGYLGVN